MNIRLLAATALAVVFGQQSYAVPLDYIALYTFEAGDASDSSTNGNDGTVESGVTFENDATRGAVASFNVESNAASGINTGIDISAAALPAMTMGGWFLRSADTATISPSLMSGDDGSYDRELSFDSRSGLSGGGATTAFSITAYSGPGQGVLNPGIAPVLGDWFHSAVSYDGTSTKLYLNGSLLVTGTDATDNGSVNTLWLGTNPGFPWEDFLGKMDDAFVYDRALSETDIQDIYDNGFTTPVPLPAGAWLMLSGLAALALARRRKLA